MRGACRRPTESCLEGKGTFVSDFYAEWCGLWQVAEDERKRSRKAIRPEELTWVETAYDSRAALLVSRATGFRTWGTSMYIAEIPKGWSTGLHRHGEECVHILEGSGVSRIGDRLYPWSAGSTIAIPFGVDHQHFNTGSSMVRYVAAQIVDLEHFAGIHRTTHLADKAQFTALPDLPTQVDGYHPDGQRIVLGLEEAIASALANRETNEDSTEAEDVRKRLDAAGGGPIEMGDTAAMLRSLALQHDKAIHLMKIGRSMNDFKVLHVEMSAINSDPPQGAGGKHAHMEAMLYVLDGTGYTVIDGERHDWGPGSALYITGPQTVHQHFVDGDTPSKMLRVAGGFRYFLEEGAKAEFPYLFFEVRRAS